MYICFQFFFVVYIYIYIYKYIYIYVFNFFLLYMLRSEIGDHMVTLCSHFEKLSNCLPNGTDYHLYHFAFSPVRAPISLYLSQLFISVFMIIAILVGMR